MVKKRKPTHPGLILEEHYLKPLNITKSSLAEAIGISRNTLYKILKKESRITADVAIRLSKALRTTPELWLNLQQKYDVWEAEHNKKVHSENIKPIVPLAAANYR
ncbi:MAG: Antitoxin HigA-1 [Candidatus Anoxychlamydiales bacterium]|nr:Antitoxin HigA-1 [Candidatus Anoxychlamydiales bacterium]